MKLPRRRFLYVAAAVAALPGRVAHRAGANLPVAARAHHRRLSARRPDRHRRAADRSVPVGTARSTIRHRESAGRRRQHRHRDGRAGATGGYTLLLVNAANAISATLYDNLNFIFLRDIAPIAGIIRVPNVMEVNPSVPARTVPEFIAYAKANPGKINMAGVNGTTLQLAGELFKMMAGVDMLHVPYKGAAPALTDLLGGQVQVLFDNLSSSIEHIRAGKLRALAVTTVTRSKALPEIPTVGEFVPGYEASAWQGIGAPREHAPRDHRKLNIEINAALADPKIKARLSDLGGGGTCRLAYRLRETPCRRNREVGQGGEVLGRKAGLIGASAVGICGWSRFYIAVVRLPARPPCPRARAPTAGS